MTASAFPAEPLRLHRFALSGHSHRAQLLLSLLNVPHALIEVDLPGGVHKTPAFLSLNTFGQVPVLEDSDAVISDSNAILVYLAERYAPTPWYPQDATVRAAIQRWLSIAAGPLATSAASARAAVLFKQTAYVGDPIQRTHDLLSVLDAELRARPFLAADHVTIADVALYTYTAHAPEGRVSLDPYPHVRAWIARIESLPGFVPMTVSKVGLRAETAHA